MKKIFTIVALLVAASLASVAQQHASGVHKSHAARAASAPPQVAAATQVLPRFRF